MNVRGLDHLVLTVQDVAATVAFYTQHFGMQEVYLGDGRVALHFGRQKINLHAIDAPLVPHARAPTPGSADLCFIVDESVARIAARFSAQRIAIIAGPVSRTGAEGPIESIYLNDPDGNLIELANRQVG